MAQDEFPALPERMTSETVYGYFKTLLQASDRASPGLVTFELPDDIVRRRLDVQCTIGMAIHNTFAQLHFKWYPTSDGGSFVLYYQSGAYAFLAADCDANPIPPPPWMERMLTKYGAPPPFHVRTPDDRVEVTVSPEQVPNVLRDFAECYRFCLERLDQILTGPPETADEVSPPPLPSILGSGAPPPERIADALARR